MKVFIKSEKTKIFILLPTALFLNRLAASIVTKIIKSKHPSIDISTKDFMRLILSIKNYKRKHRRLEVINISMTDGDVIYISL